MASISTPDKPDYSRFHDSVEIPYTNEFPDHITPAIDVLVNGTLIEKVGLDSGSTIFAISVDLLPDFPKDPSNLKRGNVEYTSGRKWSGYWYPVKVAFNGLGNKTATAEVEALVVTEQTMNGKPEDDTIHYMGIAFGTLNSAKGFTPDKNPLLAVTQYGGKPVNDSTFRHGFVMRERSILVGLTEQNTSSFRYTKLSAGSNQQVKWYWDQVSLALRLNNGVWIPGTALIDSGLTEMSIWSPEKSGDSNKLPIGTHVAIKFPNEQSDLPEYAFTWPGEDAEKEPWLPIEVNYYQSSHKNKAYVNTGQNFLAKFDTLFDADEGFWGIRNATR